MDLIKLYVAWAYTNTPSYTLDAFVPVISHMVLYFLQHRGRPILPNLQAPEVCAYPSFADHASLSWPFVTVGLWRCSFGHSTRTCRGGC
jgi:hypothetical protein